MPCVCEQCRRHAKTLGLAQRALTRGALHKAFRTAAKQWHPDRYEQNPAQRNAAEEQFKLVQVAYRELWEHLKQPAKLESAPRAEKPPTAGSPAPQRGLPAIFFGDAPGCFVAPYLPLAVRDIIACYLQGNERAVAFIDLSRMADRSQYLFLSSYRLLFRNYMGIVSMLWYEDLGEIRLVDRYKDGKPARWKRIADRFSRIQNNYALEILRTTGTPFCTLAGQADDTVKKVVYNFLRQLKLQTHS